MLRKSVFALAILLGSLASQVYALGLGTVTVESYLNQPLRVRIEILDLGSTRLQDITVQMASVDDFARFNIDRIGFLSNVRFRVEETAGGNFVILSTNQVVREPYLSFILETRWPNGRLLSEHTILMDLPVFDDQPGTSDSAQVRRPISPVLQPPSRSSSPGNAVDQPFVDSTPSTPVAPSQSVAPILEPEVIAPQPEPAAPAAAEPEPVEEESASVEAPLPESAAADVEAEDEEVSAEPAAAEEVATAAPAADEVMAEEQVTPQAEQEATPVEVAAAPEPVVPAEPETITTSASDTLTSIAEQVRPDSSVSLQQTMLALQELNPDAFIDGNINRLRSGQVLRVPSREEIESIDAADAVAEVSRQNQAFADVQPLAAPSNATPGQDQPSGQLSVVSADDAIDATGGGGNLDDEENAELDRRIAQLENQLALRQEEADRARIEREELDSRLADLEQQIAAAEELIRLQDLQLAQLQESIAQAAADAEAEAAAQAAIAAAQAEFEQQPQGGGLMNDIMRILTGNTMMMIFGVVLVVLLLVVLLLRRNKASGAREEDELDELAEQEFDAGTEAVAKPVKRVTAADSDSDDSSDFDQELDDILAAAGTDDEDSDDALDDDAGDELEGNPIAQAEILIAHEQYAQAADLLREAIAAGDNESTLRMKLMDVLALDGDTEAFEAEAKLIAAEKSPRLDRDVSQLREKYGIEAPAQEEDDDLDTFAFGEDEQAEDSAKEVAPAETAAEDDEEEASFLDDLGIDLDSFDSDSDDIDLEFSDEMEEKDSKPATETSKGSTSDDEKKMDADLDIDGDDMDLTFDLGGDDEEAGEEDDKAGDAVDEIDLGSDDISFDDEPAPAKEEAKEKQEDKSEDLDLDALLDLDDEGEKAELASGSSKDADELEIESFEFDAGDIGGGDAQEKSKDAAKDEEDLDIETFSFDVDDLKPGTEKEPEPEVEIDADKLMDFDFSDDEKAELQQADDAKPEGEAVDDIESFEFDIDESSSTTVIEPAEKAQKEGQAEAAAETTVDDFDFDLDELEAGEPEIETKSADDDDDVLDLDSAFEGLGDKDSDADSDDEVEIDFDAIDDESASPAAADDDDDLDFLADDDDDDGVEIESVDDVEEVDLLSDDDETATKLELAYAYQKMGDAEGAREILQEVIAEGTDEQVKEARELMASIDSSEG